ncbi:MAG: HAMP domain-containing sensor histidine kinase [Acidobacteriota bacterium]|nr:HAMP domain-containing sensor histidine kinase [Acidobacteriota bacterium]
MKRSGLLAFFLLPSAAVLALFFAQSTLNRSFIRRSTEALVREQLAASARILESEASRLLGAGVPASEIIGRFAGPADAYFLALLDADNAVLGWSSRFEGYLPVSKADLAGKDEWTIESPAGLILNLRRPFLGGDGRPYSLYIGYSLARLEEMQRYSRRSFLLLAAAMAAVGLLILSGVYRLHRLTLVRAEEAMAERKEKRRFQELSGFSAGIAHEIKNPLNGLALLFESLERRAPAECAEDTALGRAEVERIGRIVDQFSSAARPLEIKAERILVGDLLREAAELLAGEASRRGISLRTEAPESLAVIGDRALLLQALFNLLRNAVEATEAGAVEALAERRHGRVHIDVEDTGHGIPEADLERIFDPFTSTKPGGLGVGLFLTRKIVEAHDGTVAAEPRAEGGARFRIDLPGGRT